ncbi:MAG: sodium:calcium antiporter [Sulfurovum sp.]|nr:MAG: sodium:calcium antiporter [Sulfurovum sp.]
MDFVVFTISLAMILFGSDYIIRYGEKIALKLNISKTVITLGLISVGVSLPEFIVTITANNNNLPEMAIANVIGSNIVNMTLILPTLFLITIKIVSARNFFAKNSVWVLISVIFFILVAYDGVIDKIDGIILIFVMLAYLMFLFEFSKELNIPTLEEDYTKKFSWIKSISVILISFILIYFGAKMAIDSVSNIGTMMKISDWNVGVVLLGAGVAFPELIISVVAALKHRVDIALGSIISSILINMTMVIGTTATIKNIKFSFTDHLFDISIMLISAIVLVTASISKLNGRAVALIFFMLLTLFLRKLFIAL